MEQKPNPEIAERALREAENRRKAEEKRAQTQLKSAKKGAKRGAKESAKEEAQKEVNGRKGLEPTRYGDWENKGIAHDF